MLLPGLGSLRFCVLRGSAGLGSACCPAQLASVLPAVRFGRSPFCALPGSAGLGSARCPVRQVSVLPVARLSRSPFCVLPGSAGPGHIAVGGGSGGPMVLRVPRGSACLGLMAAGRDGGGPMVLRAPRLGKPRAYGRGTGQPVRHSASLRASRPTRKCRSPPSPGCAPGGCEPRCSPPRLDRWASGGGVACLGGSRGVGAVRAGLAGQGAGCGPTRSRRRDGGLGPSSGRARPGSGDATAVLRSSR